MPHRRLRFSAIDNFDQVAAALRRMERPAPGAYLDEIDGLVRPAKGVIGIQFERLGYVEIRGGKFRER